VDILFVEFGKHVELILQPLGQDVIILGLQLLLALLHCSVDYCFDLQGVCFRLSLRKSCMFKMPPLAIVAVVAVA